MEQIQVKRIYEAADPEDGYRVLADRLWPRGIRKEAACLDDWVKELAPSDALRKRFAHQADRFADFREAYRKELDANPHAAEFAGFCLAKCRTGKVTLLYAAKDESDNNAVVLREWIEAAAVTEGRK